MDCLPGKCVVGVSLKIADVTFLFINAHLAAHAGRVDLRMANLSKIKVVFAFTVVGVTPCHLTLLLKTELSLDAFLGADDPRRMAEGTYKSPWH